MEEIKRYKIDLECRDKVDQWGRNLLLDDTNGNLVKYADHKAVVETKDETISNYLTAIKEDNDKFKELYSTIEAMQNKIDELEKVNRKMQNCSNCGWGSDECFYEEKDPKKCGEWYLDIKGD